MNYINKIDNIICLLERSFYFEEANKVRLLKSSASTSLELLMSIGKELKRIKDTNTLNDFITSEINDLIDFCTKNGLYIR